MENLLFQSAIDIIEETRFWLEFGLALTAFLSGWFGKKKKDEKSNKQKLSDEMKIIRQELQKFGGDLDAIRKAKALRGGD